MTGIGTTGTADATGRRVPGNIGHSSQNQVFIKPWTGRVKCMLSTTTDNVVSFFYAEVILVKRTFLAIFVIALAGQALAVNKCTDSSGKVTFQEKACDADKSQANVKVWKDGGDGADAPSRNPGGMAAATDLVALQEASLVILQKKGGSFVVFTLHPRWKNDNPSKVSIHFKTQFFDSSRTEIGVNNRIQEVDPKRGFVQVLSSPILTFELHKKVTSKYNRSACGVDNVLKLCVGVHRSQSQTRLRVVAVIDLLVLDSKHILRAMAVWQWGYGATQPISLQFLLSPPSGTDYFYHPENIAAADNIVFVAGASTKGPCIFMCKPSVREAWSANFLASSGKITSMAVTTAVERNYPYMAVGMSDGSLSVWTYAAALKQSVSKKDEPFRRLLYPLCRLDALWVLNSLQASSFADDKKHKSDGK